MKKYYIIDRSGNRQYKKYCDCGKMIAFASKRCRKCAGNHRIKMNNIKREANEKIEVSNAYGERRENASL